MRQIHETPAKYDLKEFSGFLLYDEGETSRNITIKTLSDTEEEVDELFVVKLIAARGEARVAETDNVAILTGGWHQCFLSAAEYTRKTTE